ncbi:uncharacterized protein G2W53_007956 [Senna tora]|uniref:Uncharacterized protein n=1 Tax=Senna tora TaxID=362788 RepID=A0A835CER8_9FABA|nr:uncharacterized protein G2W53_007956 [Senna tora]
MAELKALGDQVASQQLATSQKAQVEDETDNSKAQGNLEMEDPLWQPIWFSPHYLTFIIIRPNMTEFRLGKSVQEEGTPECKYGERILGVWDLEDLCVFP